MSFSLSGVPDVQQEITLQVSSLSGSAVMEAFQEIGGLWVSMGSIPLVYGRNTLKVVPSQTDYRVHIKGPGYVMVERMCAKVPSLGQESMLVDVCDDDGDRYRFGFNGQEKVNEWAGIGNHNTAQFWEYDTRTGRRLNLDPVDQINVSNYASLRGNPILYIDPKGNVVRFNGYKNKKDAPMTDQQAEEVWKEIVAYMYEHGISDEYDALVKSNTVYDIYFTVKLMANETNNTYVVNRNGEPRKVGSEIIVNPWQNIEYKGYFQSGLVGIAHEIGHAFLFDSNLKQYIKDQKTSGEISATKHEDMAIEIENKYSQKVKDNPSGQQRNWHLISGAMNYIKQGKTWKPRGDTKGGGEMPAHTDTNKPEQKKTESSGSSNQSWERTDGGGFLINTK